MKIRQHLTCLVAAPFLLLTLAGVAEDGALLAGGDVRKRQGGITVGTPPSVKLSGLKPAPINVAPPTSPTTTITMPNPPEVTPPATVSSNPITLPIPPFAWIDRAHQASRTLGDVNNAEQITSQYTGLGRVAGEMAQMEVTNRSSEPLSLRFVPGMVLESPPSAGAQPLMLEEEFSLKLNPGESVKRNLICYCLDYDIQPPEKGAVIPYTWSTRIQPHWAESVKVLVAGLNLEKSGGYTPMLAPLQHRRVVIQRAIWQQLEQVEGLESLRKDLVKDSQGQITRRTADRISKGIYSDIERTLEGAQAIR